MTLYGYARVSVREPEDKNLDLQVERLVRAELSVLARQCLDRRIPDEETLVWEVVAWEEARNAQGNPVDWRFTTADARIKLKHLYPSIQE